MKVPKEEPDDPQVQEGRLDRLQIQVVVSGLLAHVKVALLQYRITHLTRKRLLMLLQLLD